MDSSDNVYFDYILFTLLMTTLISIFYIYIFDIKTQARFIDRIFKIFIAVSVLFYILRKLGYSLENLIQLIGLIFMILYLICFIYTVYDYFINDDSSNRSKSLKLFGLFVGLLIIIGIRKILKIEVENVFNFRK